MRRTLLVVSVFLCGMSPLRICAQKIGYIDSEIILEKMPAYHKAQSEIDNLSRSWQDEIEEKQVEIRGLYYAFEAEKMLLTEKMRKEKKAEIHTKEQELNAYQKKIFGFEGLLFLKKQELIEPLQRKIFEAIKKVAKKKKIAIVFDRAGELVMIYTDPVHDYTDFVLEELELGDSNDVVK